MRFLDINDRNNRRHLINPAQVLMVIEEPAASGRAAILFAYENTVFVNERPDQIVEQLERALAAPDRR